MSNFLSLLVNNSRCSDQSRDYKN